MTITPDPDVRPGPNLQKAHLHTMCDVCAKFEVTPTNISRGFAVYKNRKQSSIRDFAFARPNMLMDNLS